MTDFEAMQPITQCAICPEIMTRIDDAGVVAVLVIDDVNNAVPLAKSLLAGGVNAIELTLRTPVAFEAARIIKAEVPEILLGFGTVLTTKQVDAAVKVGADFAVAPGCNPNILDASIAAGLNVAPGISTPSEMEMAIEKGCRVLKYFPAETLGGMKHLQNMVAPYKYLDLKFIPLGGLNIDNAASYLSSPLITAIGGSWIAKQDMIQAQQWDAITQNAQAITDLIKVVRSK